MPVPLIIPAGGIAIAYQSEANFSVSTLNLPVELDYNETYTFVVTFAPQTLGAKNATLIVMDNLSRNFHAVLLNGNGIEEEVGMAVNLQATVQNGMDVILTWTEASTEPGRTNNNSSPRAVSSPPA